MQEKGFVEVLNREVEQLHRYQKLLRTTIAYVGEQEANEVFTIIPPSGRPLCCSPVHFVAMEEILVDSLLNISTDVIAESDAEMEDRLERFLNPEN